MSDNNINKWVDDALNSMDHSERAQPRPYLLSRIQARLQNKGELTLWDRLSAIITRPAITFAGLVLIIALNVFIIFSNNSSTTNLYSSQAVTDAQGFSIANTTALYDIENIEP